MNSSYDAIYQAVANELSAVRPHLQQEIYAVSGELQRPSVLFRPELFREGNQWCAMYGKNAHDGVIGFGDTPDAASRDFDKNWREEKASR